MDDKNKKILNLFLRYMDTVKCDVATFTVDMYNFRPYGRQFTCTSSETGNKSVNTVIDISDFIYNVLEENNNEIFEDDGDGGYANTIEFVIDKNLKQIIVNGLFSTLEEMDNLTEHGEVEIPEQILISLKEHGITVGTVDFDGGGDSGVIEDYIYRDGGNVLTSEIGDDFNSFLEGVLDNYGDWYNNEGARGSIEIDTEEGLARYTVFPREYVDSEYTFFKIPF
jgi:hypothetical protein